jgi:outer membrane receptor for ferrienterochelin and colicin
MTPALLGLLAAIGLLPAPPLAWPLPGPDPAQPPARIVGRVVDPTSRAGIGSVRVRLDDGPDEAVSAADGAFEFSNVTAGPHRLVASLEGFVASPVVSLDVAEGADARVEVEYALMVTTEVRGDTPPAPPVRAVELGSTTVTGDQVATAVGALDDVARVMQLQPGVAASEDDRNDILVRGGGAYETAVRINGFEVPTASHFAWPGSAGGGLSLIPSAIIDRASVETSGFSVAFGERASALFDVDTRKGTASRLGGRVDVSAGGVLGLLEGRLPAGAGSWLLSARRSILELVFSRGDSRATPTYKDLFTTIDLPVSDVHHARVLVLGASDGLHVDWNGSSQQTIDGDQQLAMVGLGLDSAWTKTTRTALSVSWSDTSGTLSEPLASVSSFREYSTEAVVRARGELRQSLGRRAELLVGATLRHASADFDLQDGQYRNDYGILVPAIHSVWTSRSTDAAGYTEVAISPIRPLRLVVGARADHSGMTGSWYGSPRTRIEYQPAPGWRVTGTWGKYRQDIPSIWIGSNAGNRSLDPVEAVQATIGLAAEPWRGTRLTAEGFAKRYTGYPVDPATPARVLIGVGADFESSPLVGRLVAAGQVHADGVDLSASQRVTRSLDIAAGYSYWNVKEYNLERQWIPADNDIRHQGRVWLVWRSGSRWTSSVLWRYASGRPYTPFDVTASIRANAGRRSRSQNNAATYPPYHRLDARVDRVFVQKRAAVTAFFEVDNIYDRDNVLMYEWSRYARQPTTVYQWGITPVAGVRVQF